MSIPRSRRLSTGCIQLIEEAAEESLYDLVYYPDSGQIIQMHSRSFVPNQLSNLQRLLLSTKEAVIDVVDAATPNFIYRQGRANSTAPGRAFNTIYRHMTAGGLITHATLKYDSLPSETTIKRDIAQFAKRLRKKHPVLRYVAVPEHGDQFGGFHWHFAGPSFLEDSLIQDAWIRGSTYITRMPNYEALVSLINYFGKTFFMEAENRAFPHRYKKDKSSKMRKIEVRALNQAEVEMFVHQQTGINACTLTTKTRPNDWVVAVHNWKPEHLNSIF